MICCWTRVFKRVCNAYVRHRNTDNKRCLILRHALCCVLFISWIPSIPEIVWRRKKNYYSFSLHFQFCFRAPPTLILKLHSIRKFRNEMKISNLLILWSKISLLPLQLHVNMFGHLCSALRHGLFAFADEQSVVFFFNFVHMGGLLAHTKTFWRSGEFREDAKHAYNNKCTHRWID